MYRSHSENKGALDPKEPGENATGLYRKTFTLPEKWVSGLKSAKKGKGKKDGKVEGETDRVFMVFEGVDCCANFWLDGVYIGFSKDSCLPCEFDVTDAIASSSSSADHLLAVQVCIYVSVFHPHWFDSSFSANFCVVRLSSSSYPLSLTILLSLSLASPGNNRS
jgi:hypothetical protein